MGLDMNLEKTKLKHQQTKRCDWNMQMRWRRRYVTTLSQCEDATFIITVKYDVKCIEGFDTFK